MSSKFSVIFAPTTHRNSCSNISLKHKSQCVYLYILTNTCAFVFLKHVTRAAIQSEVVELHTLLYEFVLYTNVIYYLMNSKYIKT